NLTADLFPAPGIRDFSVVFLAVDDEGPALRHLDDPDDPGSITTLSPDFETRPDGLVLDPTGGLAACVFDGDIRLVNLRSNLSRPLVVGLGVDTDPAWTADSRALVFADDRGEGYDLYVVDLQTGEPVRLTVEPGDERHPAVDQDNQTVYFFGDISGRPGVYRRVETPAGAPTLEFVFGVEGELTHLALWP
ncbi:PD40 domain-containing protein, partial [bacterium]|nr:PD40 domain-containing protein [bacterium]